MAKRTTRKPRFGVQRLKRWLRRLGILLVTVAIGYGVVWLLSALGGDRPGFALPDLGRGHMEVQRCSPQYNSAPPTSGCHSQSLVPYGIHDEPIRAELQVHNLEHGAVMIQYRPSGIIGLGDDLVGKLMAHVNRLRESDRRYCRLILAPHPPPFSIPSRPEEDMSQKVIALTAWTRIDVLEEYDEARIQKFIDAFINRGPESVPATECQ
jgi:hypothetical protein